MNNINELISIIKFLGEKATTEEICREYLKKYKIVFNSSYVPVIYNTLSNNPDLVYKNHNIWVLKRAQEKNELLVTDNLVFYPAMSTDSFMENIIEIINNVTEGNLSRNQCRINGKRLSFKWLNIFQPNYKDLNDVNHIHYNPAAIINVMPKQKMYDGYSLYMCPVKVKIDREGYPWICVEDVKAFVSFVEYLHKQGYVFE